MIDNWTLRKRPLRLERRIDFDNYDLTRDFLDQSAELSEQEDFYPDMNFGRTHVSMTIHAEEGSDEISPKLLAFAEKLNDFAPTNKISAPLDADNLNKD